MSSYLLIKWRNNFRDIIQNWFSNKERLSIGHFIFKIDEIEFPAGHPSVINAVKAVINLDSVSPGPRFSPSTASDSRALRLTWFDLVFFMLVTKQVHGFLGLSFSLLRQLSTVGMDGVEAGKKAAAHAAVNDLVKVGCFLLYSGKMLGQLFCTDILFLKMVTMWHLTVDRRVDKSFNLTD